MVELAHVNTDELRAGGVGFTQKFPIELPKAELQDKDMEEKGLTLPVRPHKQEFELQQGKLTKLNFGI